MSKVGKGETTFLVNEDVLTKNNLEDKLRDRAISEGYKYRTLDESVSSGASSDSDTVKSKPETLWSQRYHRLVCLLAIAVFIIAFLVAIVIYQHVKKDDNSEVCTKTECVHASAFITQQMDRTVDPCQDFYKFVCGNWEDTVTIPDTRAKYNTFSVVADKNKKYIKQLLESNSTTIKGNKSATVAKMKSYFKMCMDQTTIDKLDSTPLKQFIEEIGSWTISGSGWDERSWKLEDILGKIHRYSYSPLFSVGIGIDDKNSTQYVLMFSQPGLTLQAREEYNTTYSKYDELHDAMLHFGATLGSYLGSDYNQTRSKMEDIYKFEQKLAEIFLPQEILRQPELIYHKMKLKDLQDIMGDWIDLSLYMKKLTLKDLPDTEDIIVYTPEYLRKLGPIVKNTDKSVLANYMVWNAVNYLIGYLPLKYTKTALILDKVEKGVDKLDSMWERCTSKTNAVFGFGTGALYVEQHFSESSKTEVEDILQRVRLAFSANMPSVDWMDQPTQEKALEKLQFITPMIGYPDWILDTTKLDKYYENVTIAENELFKTYLSHRQVESDRDLNKLGTTPDRTEWSMKPYEVNAYYSPQYNQIVFPAGILQRPFYDPDFPTSYSFGAVGGVIGHEMTHGFDDQGRLYDKFGNLHNWWTNQSSKEFKEKSQCMIDQYSGFTYQGNHIMGERTQGENMADNGGVKSAYTAFSKWKKDNSDERLPGLDYTPEQMFFMGFGQIWCSHYTKAYAKTSILTDVHSPAPVRPNGIAVNSAAFSKAFHCPKGSPMNPAHKCEVW